MTTVAPEVQSPYDLQRWHIYRDSTDTKQRFLFFLAPIMEHIYQLCCQQVDTSQHLHNIISHKLILNTLMEQYESTFIPMVLKCSLWELHVADQDKIQKTTKQKLIEFTKNMASAEYIEHFLNQYPPLKKAIDNKVATIIHNWQLFFTRLDADWQTVSQAMLGNDTYRIHHISGTGDTHRLGQHVMRIDFQNKNNLKQSIIYKPRDLGIDLAYNGLIRWLNQHYALTLETFTIIKRDGYGWCEFVTHDSCTSIDAVERCYQRYGALLAVMYSLNGDDIHFENIIAHGEHPIIVDLECLLKPALEANASLEKPPSVLDSLLLPTRLDVEDETEGWSIGGLSGDGSGKIFNAGLNIVGTDSNDVVIKRSDIEINNAANNRVLYNGRPHEDYELSYQNVLRGFTECYQIISQHKDFLCSDQSPLNLFNTTPARYLLRGTNSYAILLRESFHPDIMESETAWQTHFNWLDAMLEEQPTYSGLVASEKQDLTYGDIPYFSYDPQQNCILNGHDEKVDIKIHMGGLDRVKQHLRSLEKNDLHIQQHIIAGSYATYQLNQDDDNKKKSGAENTHKLHINKLSDSSTKTIAHKHANALLKKINRLTINKEHHITWPCITVAPIGLKRVFTISITSHGFWSGSLGIALTFAVASKYFLDQPYPSLASSYVAIFENNFMQRNETAASNFNVIDRTSLSYAFKQMQRSNILVSGSLIDPLLSNAEDKIADDQEFGLSNGVAGMMMVTADKTLLQKLVDHLLEHYPNPSQYPENKHFKPIDGASMIGFAYGVSGINVALAHANKYLNDANIEAWIQQSLNYLDEVYEQYGYWPDMRTLEKGGLWSHGCVGVGEGYLSLLDTHPTEQVERGLNRAIEQVQKACDEFTPDKPGYYCDGYLGAHNFILNAHLKRPDLVTQEMLQHENNRLLSHLDQYGYNAFAIGDGIDLSLLYGLSGLAYHLMRLTDPENIPSILTMQS
ncbi:MAG: type 2 lantipeptide synthetase LanM family protein [Gammaproteobacteria bacterium]|nr:type 2 lantipeptide synthetase LanM family protein [Gammaproteobacteria bacterium]MCH9744667.1 type 2 lantipeptide synthetase LanM family protein [Gammaproteobacteria bacterium]